MMNYFKYLFYFVALVLTTMVARYAIALPLGGQVVQGQGQLNTQEQHLQVNQSSDFLHLQFDSFNISKQESVDFNQPDIQSVVINEVLSSDPTEIAGQLSANGQLFIVAPGGLIIHEGVTIEATSFFASTLPATNITSGQLDFIGADSHSSLINRGTINIDGGGYLQLLGGHILNEGLLKNQNGDVGLNVAQSALVRFNQDLFAIELTQSALDGLIENHGTIKSEAGDVTLQASVRNQIHELAINNEGAIQAQAIWQSGGDIYIGSNEGDVENHGLIESLGQENIKNNGAILIDSNRIANFGEIKNNGLGDASAGKIELLAEESVVLMADSKIEANAEIQGDGGFIKVFSPDTALFRLGARIEAEAGFNLGNGGFVDVSGWQHVEVAGQVSTLALNGKNGEFLIDPYDVTISNAVDSNQSWNGATYTPLGNASNILVSLLETNLQAGDVTVVTTGIGVENGDITVAVDIDLDGTHGNTLQLTADGSINVSGDLSDSSGSGDATNVVLQAGGSINMASGAEIDSGGGVVTLTAGGNVSIGTVSTDGASMFVTAGGNVQHVGNAGPGYDISTGGGTVSFNVNGNIGGTSFTDSLEVTNSIVDIFASNANRNVYLSNDLATGLTINNVDYNGGDGLSLNVRSTNDGTIIVSGDIFDSDTGSADSATINLETQGFGSDITINDGASLISNGGDIILNSSRDVSIAETWSSGGAITITADDIFDNGTAASDFNSGGGVLTLNVSGNIGTDRNSAIEVSGSVLEINNTGTNQAAHIGAEGLTLNNVDFDGTGTYSLNLYLSGTGDLHMTGSIDDSVTATTDVATIYIETLDSSSDIILYDGISVKSYGGDITYNSAGWVGLSNTVTGGGALNITATRVYDNSNTNADIQTDGGTAFFTVSDGVGVFVNGSIDVADTLITGSATGANSVWDFRGHTSSTYFELRTIDYDGTGTFSLVAKETNGGEIRVNGFIYDSNTATNDRATLSLETTVAGSDIVMSGGSRIESNGGVITYISADEIGLAQTLSGGGAINITAAGNIYDNSSVGSELSSGGGLITLNPGANVGGTSQATAIEIFNSVLDMNIVNSNQNVYLNVDVTDGYLNLNNVDFNGGDGLTFDVLAQNGSDIVVAGSLYDSDATTDSAIFNLVTNSNTGDITINPNATIRTGSSGGVTLNSANDLYLTGVFGGTAGTVITAANDIIDNGDVNRDIQSSGAVVFDAGRHIADGDNIDVVATSLSIDMGTGNHNFVATGNIELGNIEIDGANGGNLSVLGTGDIDLTGSITDAVGSDDAINLTLGTSSPGFIIFPDTGYTVPGNLTFWSGTSGIKDSTDERVSITANSLISSGNNFLLNTGSIIFDLSVNNIDFNDGTGTHSFEINNDKSLTIQDLDSDGEFLLGKDYKLNVAGDLTIPNVTMNSVDDQLWLIADDISDSGADNIVTIRDSGDAGSEFRLIVDLTGANDVQINNSATMFDGTVAAGGVLTINHTLQTSTLELGVDLNGDGSFANGAGDLIISTENGGDLLIANTGLSTIGGLTLNVGGHLYTQSNQAINLSSSLLDVDVLNATSGLVFGIISSDDININTNEVITINGGSLSATGNIFLHGADITSDTGRDLTLAANQVYLEFDNQVSANTLFLTAQSFDATGNASLVLTNSNALHLTDFNADGLLLAGFSSLDIAVGGVLTLDAVGLSVAGDMSISADYIVDGDNFVALSASRLFVDYSSPLTNTYRIGGNIGEFNASIAGNLQVNTNGNINIIDWHNDGFILNSVEEFELVSAGNITLPATGLSSATSIWLEGASISDGDSNLTLNTGSLGFYSAESDADYVLTSTAAQADIRLSGAQSNVRMNSSSDLQIMDLNSDGSSLQIADGYGWVNAAGSLIVSDAVSVIDANDNTLAGGWLYLGYSGSATIGATINVDSSAESTSSSLVPYTNAGLVIQQQGLANASNVLQLASSASISAIGGDVVLDITNGSGEFAGAGSLVLEAGSVVTAQNQVSEQVLPVIYTDYVPAGEVTASTDRTVNLFGLTLASEEPIADIDVEVTDEINQALSDAVSDVLGESDQVVAQSIQDETVSAVESSPNVNFALNEMFSGCRQGSNEDSRCKVKEEISRFLGRFLMGGSMPRSSK